MQIRRIAIIADDLTGAADTGVQFCPFFEDTLLTGFDQITPEYEKISPASSQALAIYTNSRSLDEDLARKRMSYMAHILKTIRLDWLYKKVDSCLRGNIGAETEALMVELGYDVSFIAPAFPAMGRTTVDDIHLVYGKPVDQTEIGKDPVTPVTDSHLSRVVASQSRYPTGHVGLDLVQGPETELHAKVRQLIDNGIRHVVFDTTSQQHLDRIARLMFTLPFKVLSVGSAGLAASIGFVCKRKVIDHENSKVKSPAGNYLLVCGSASIVTEEQVAELTSAYPYKTITLKPDLLADPHRRNELFSRADSVGAVLAEHNTILRIDSPTKEDSQPASEKPSADPEHIVEGLALFTAAVLKAKKPAGLFLTGGDTANAILRALDANGIHILGEIAIGMVEGKLAGGFLRGLAVVTKAGAFGSRDTLVKLHESWNHSLGHLE